MIKELNRFHKLSFLKGNNPILAKVIEVITDVEKCKVSKIHPTEVLIHMKTMERGKYVSCGKLHNFKIMDFIFNFLLGYY